MREVDSTKENNPSIRKIIIGEEFPLLMSSENVKGYEVPHAFLQTEDVPHSPIHLREEIEIADEEGVITGKGSISFRKSRKSSSPREVQKISPEGFIPEDNEWCFIPALTLQIPKTVNLRDKKFGLLITYVLDTPLVQHPSLFFGIGHRESRGKIHKIYFYFFGLFDPNNPATHEEQAYLYLPNDLSALLSNCNARVIVFDKSNPKVALQAQK